MLVARDGIPAPTGHDRTAMVVYQRADEPGSLISILQEFAARRINLSNLISRPTKRGGLGDYCFVIYAEAHIADELMADALRALHAKQGGGEVPRLVPGGRRAGPQRPRARRRPLAPGRRLGRRPAPRTRPHRPLNRAEHGPARGRTVCGAMSDAPVSVVTGANSGIGRATAIHLAQQGHRVFGTVRATSRMDTFHKMAEAAGVEIELVELDVAEDDSVARRLRRDPRRDRAASTCSSTTPASAATRSPRRRRPSCTWTS